MFFIQYCIPTAPHCHLPHTSSVCVPLTSLFLCLVLRKYHSYCYNTNRNGSIRFTTGGGASEVHADFFVCLFPFYCVMSMVVVVVVDG